MPDQLVSIIVPAFNVEKYIRKCLESLARQTYTNIEVLIVNDGSTDSTERLCSLFCQEDNRFRVVSQPNAGIGPARNRGIDLSSGEYLMFVDADDTLSPLAVETAYDCICSGPYDWAQIGFVRVGLDGTRMPFHGEPSAGQEVITGEEAISRMFFGADYDRRAFIQCTNKLFSRRVLRGFHFGDFRFAEDQQFVFRVYLKTTCGIYSRTPLYYYLQRPESNMHAGEKTYYDGFLALGALETESMPPSIRGIYLKKLIRKILLTRFLLIGTPYYADFMHDAKLMLSRIKREFVFQKDIPTKEKLLFFILWPFPRLGRLLFKWKGN